MSTFVLSNNWKYHDKLFRFDVYKSQDFSNLGKIKQVYGIMLNKERNKIMVVYNSAQMWILPGGGNERNETPMETLEREILEETNCDIDLIETTPFFYQEKVEVDSDDNFIKSEGFELRYITTVETERDFVEDPDNGDISKTKWISFDEIPDFLQWGEVAIFMRDELKEKFN